MHAAPHLLSPSSAGRAAEQAERAALARSAGGMLSRADADIAGQKPTLSVALRAHPLCSALRAGSKTVS